MRQAISELVGQRAFILIWCARIFCYFAVQAESVTLGWQVYTVARHARNVDRSAFLVGMVGLVQFVPLFLFSFIAGSVADRFDRRKIMLVCIAGEFICALLLAGVAARPGYGLLPVFVLAGCFGVSRAFLAPATEAALPMVVPRALMPTAIGLGSVGDKTSAVLGPWLGGLLCAVSVPGAYLAAALFYGFAEVALLVLRAETRPAGTAGSHLRLIREGLAYVWTNKVLLGATSLDLFVVLLGGATALLPVYARDVLHVGPHGFGVLRSGPAIGAMVMAVALSRRPLRRHAGQWMFAGTAVFALATIVFAVSKSMAVSVVALAALGAADMVSVFIRTSLTQIVTPDAMRGRVSAVSGVFVGASNELGEFESGVVTRLIGPVGSVLFGGIGSLLITGVWALLFPALREADDLAGPVPAGGTEAAREAAIKPRGAALQ